MAKSTAVLGMEIGRDAIRVAVLDSGTRRILLTQTFEVSGDAIQDPSIMEGVIDLLEKQLELPIVERVIALEKNRCVLRLVEVPIEIRNAEDYVRWELGSVINSKMEDYYYDFQVIGSNAAENARLIIAAGIRKSLMDGVVNKYVDYAKFPTVVDIDVFCVLNSLELADPEQFKSHNILIKAGFSEIVIIRSIAGVFSQLTSISVRSYKQSLDDSAKTLLLNKYVAEVKNHLASLKGSVFQEGDINPDIYVCGPLCKENAFVGKLQENENFFSIKELSRYADLKFAVEGNVAADLSQYAGAVGAALRESGDT